MRVLCLLLLLAAGATAATTIEQYHSHDFVYQAVAPGNPFDVELVAHFTGPEGAHLAVPGFYDGDGMWKIRFAPPRQGEWSMRTSSSLETLAGNTETGIVCASN